jgi:hypothetical protein
LERGNYLPREEANWSSKAVFAEAQAYEAYRLTPRTETYWIRASTDD